MSPKTQNPLSPVHSAFREVDVLVCGTTMLFTDNRCHRDTRVKENDPLTDLQGDGRSRLDTSAPGLNDLEQLCSAYDSKKRRKSIPRAWTILAISANHPVGMPAMVPYFEA